MVHYLVDLYSSSGSLFKSERIVAQDDVLAVLEAKGMMAAAKPASYKVTRLTKSGNVIIRDSSKPVV